MEKYFNMTTKSGSRCHYDLEGEFIPCEEASKMTGQMTPGGYMRTTPSRWLSQFNYCPFCGTYLSNELIVNREKRRMNKKNEKIRVPGGLRRKSDCIWRPKKGEIKMNPEIYLSEMDRRRIESLQISIERLTEAVEGNIPVPVKIEHPVLANTGKEIWSEKQITGNGCSWEDAFKFAESLNTENHLGLLDWRVPERWELIRAYDNKVQGFEASWFWSSSGSESDSSVAWVVYFGDGYVGSDDKGSNGYVRCVASGL